MDLMREYGGADGAAIAVELIRAATSHARKGLEDVSGGETGRGIFENFLAAKSILGAVVDSSSLAASFQPHIRMLSTCMHILREALDHFQPDKLLLLGEESGESIPLTPQQQKHPAADVDCAPFPALPQQQNSIDDITSQQVTQDKSPITTTPRPSFAEIIGQRDAKRALRENVVLPLSLSPEVRDIIFRGARGLSAAGVLLYGPPGTGKTSLAKAAASEASATLLTLTPSGILSKYQGESERAVRDIFSSARSQAPACIFLDEIDALGPSRDGMDDLQGRRLLAELLLQLSSLTLEDRVAVLAATNRVDDVDVALLRRFHARVGVGLPDACDRLALISKYLDGLDHTLTPLDKQAVAARTESWSGSDVSSLVREASLVPLRELSLDDLLVGKMSTEELLLELRPVTPHDFDTAYSFLMNEGDRQDKKQLLMEMV